MGRYKKSWCRFRCDTEFSGWMDFICYLTANSGKFKYIKCYSTNILHLWSSNLTTSLRADFRCNSITVWIRHGVRRELNRNTWVVKDSPTRKCGKDFKLLMCGRKQRRVFTKTSIWTKMFQHSNTILQIPNSLLNK